MTPSVICDGVSRTAFDYNYVGIFDDVCYYDKCKYDTHCPCDNIRPYDEMCRDMNLLHPSDDVLLNRGLHCIDGITVDGPSFFTRSPDVTGLISLTFLPGNIAANRKSMDNIVIVAYSLVTRHESEQSRSIFISPLANKTCNII